MLSAGPTPQIHLESWTFSITEGGRTKKSWNWEEFQDLPTETITADIHCVTRWTKLGTQWRGVSVDTLLNQAAYDAPYVMAFSDGGYTTKLADRRRHCARATSPGSDLRLQHIWGSMETTAIRGRLSWQVATVVAVTRETVSVATIVVDLQAGLGIAPGSTWTSG